MLLNVNKYFLSEESFIFLYLDQNNPLLILCPFPKEKTQTLILESFLLALAHLLKFYMDSSGVIYRCFPQESVKVN